jgi:flagellar motor switch/type III secretory pathway protein FliN
MALGFELNAGRASAEIRTLCQFQQGMLVNSDKNIRVVVT